MKKLNVLVTGIGGPIAQGILHGLKDIEDVHLIGADRREVTTGNQFCDEVRLVPPLSELDQYKKAIQEIINNDNIDAIFPCLHEEVEVYREFREQLPVPVALPASVHETLLMDKEKVYQFLESCGLDEYLPRYVGFDTSEELQNIKAAYFAEDPYIVVKQVKGHGSLGFSILMSREHYLDAYQRGMGKAINIDDYIDIEQTSRRIAMEYIEEIEHSVDVFMHDGKVITAVPRKRTGVSNGIVLDGTVVQNEELIEASIKISEKVAHSGFLNLQFMGNKLTDLNPRFCGSQVMSLGANVNFPNLFLQYQVRKQPVEVNPIWNTRMLRYRESLFIYES